MTAERVNRKPRPPQFGGLLLGLFAVMLLPTALLALFQGDLWLLFKAGLGFLILLQAAWLTRRGIRQEKEYKRRALASSPPPLKTLAMILTGLAAFLISSGLTDRYNLLVSLTFTALAALGYYLYYGLDPRGEKASGKLGGYSTEELVEILNEAEAKLEIIEAQGRKLTSRELAERLDKIVIEAREVIGILEKNPKDLRRARKFLNVYLDGARQVTEGYANMHSQADSEILDNNFRDVLSTIEATFKEQKRKLLSHEMLDLDIQIEVLKKQMEEEGITT
ncbi:MAG TPA: 5-bromo-4-chloroindolyl phosphate hydrolase [Chromatiales bacterium]|nr:5-bromo-4-chloroindolyl phosphate hydrolase [Thiotrichales bacterium]HIP69485.1 5-bromo-4-chloroindolyl phosphate hydrolase [Chromatiales bacterium]